MKRNKRARTALKVYRWEGHVEAVHKHWVTLRLYDGREPYPNEVWCEVVRWRLPLVRRGSWVEFTVRHKGGVSSRLVHVVRTPLRDYDLKEIYRRAKIEAAVFQSLAA